VLKIIHIRNGKFQKNKGKEMRSMIMEKNDKKPVSLLLAILIHGLALVTLFYFTSSTCFALTSDKALTKTEYVSIDFDNVDIKVFIKFISKLTQKNFVVDKRVKGNVTVISPTKISIEEAYKVFESVLEIHGFSTVTSGSVIKILPQPNAKADNIDTRLISGTFEPSDRLVTRIIPLEYANSDELKKLFLPLLPKGSVILSYRDTNMIIVTATLSSISRLLKIIKTIDVPSIGKKISVVPVKYADTAKLIKNLSSIFTARIQGGKGKQDKSLLVKFVADERTNSVILLASKLETERAEKLIALLDQQVPKGEERIRVYYLEHASAEELVKVLQDIPTEEKKTAGKKEAPILSQKVHISADKATNSLIIMAEKEDYPVLEEVISKLDIPRAMVYIECLIMEVNVSRGLDIGTEWQTGQSFDDGQKIGFGGFGATGGEGYLNTGGIATDGNLPTGFSLGVLGKSFNIGGVTFTDIQAVIQAYQSDKDVNILSTPQILTTENEEAVITVGKNVAFQTQSNASLGTDTYSSYEYKDVGVSLKITPQISKERLVRLKVFQELTKLDSTTTANPDRPATFKRQIETTIIVEDGHSVVIGGLIDESTTKGTYKTPCLGDIPLLGWAFKTVSEGEERTNMYVFITPRVVKGSLEAQEMYKQKRQSIETELKKGEISLFDKIDKFEKKISGQKEAPAAENEKP
jgi:general secretion pathway protein D